jgi:hypothetical protein
LKPAAAAARTVCSDGGDVDETVVVCGKQLAREESPGERLNPPLG